TRLTDRLRRLEAAGIITRESPGTGREVWYQLTDAGLDLGPAIDALTLWGIEHAREGPLADEPVHPVPAMLGTKVWLYRNAPPPPEGLTWVWRFPGEDHYTLSSRAGTWQLARGRQESAVVTTTATPRGWAGFLTTPREKRRLPAKGISLEGGRADLNRF